MKRLVNRKDYQTVITKLSAYLLSINAEKMLTLYEDDINEYILYKVQEKRFIVHIIQQPGKSPHFGFQIYMGMRNLDVQYNLDAISKFLNE